MILDARLQFDDLLSGFCEAESLCDLDKAIIDHAIDNWPMGSLAREHGKTATALHRREKELKLQFREYLKNRGYNSSSDVFDDSAQAAIPRAVGSSKWLPRTCSRSQRPGSWPHAGFYRATKERTDDTDDKQ